MAIDEKALREQEEAFPHDADRAFRAARQRALDAGGAVTETQGDAIYRVYPDGRREFVKHIDPPLRYKTGTVFRIP